MSNLYQSYKVMKSNEEQPVKTISSREVAEMMEKSHADVLTMIHGKADRKGIIQVLTRFQIDVSEYFIESSYTDASGKSNREYQVTKKGCEFLIQKSTGKKGYLLANKINTLFPNEVDSIIITNLDRKEIKFLDQLEQALQPFNIEGKRQYSVLNYRIDYYIPSLNIAIEYDENEHKNYTYEAHEGRQRNIEKELGCRFIRVNDSNTDNYNIGLIIKNIFKL